LQSRGLAEDTFFLLPAQSAGSSGQSAMLKASSMPSMSAEHKVIQKAASMPSLRGCTVFLHGAELKLTEDFLEEHPGGRDLIEVWAGRDITREFEDAGHSASARQWASRFAVPGTSSKAKEVASNASKACKEDSGRPSTTASRVGALLFAMLGNEMQGAGRTSTWMAAKQAALLDDGLPLTLGLISFASAITAWHLRSVA